MGVGVVAFTTCAAHVKVKYTDWCTLYRFQKQIFSPCLSCFSPGALALLYQSSLKQVIIRMCKITLDARIPFYWRHERRCQGLLGTKHSVRTYVGNVKFVRRKVHNNTMCNTIWFSLSLTDTRVNIEYVLANCYIYRNSNLPATESRLWGRRLYLFGTTV